MPKFTAVVSIFGPLALLSASSLLIIRSVNPDAFFSHALYLLLAFIIIAALGKFDYQLYIFSPWPWYFLSLFILSFTLVLGQVIRGASRWINLAGISVQTSELAKPMLIIFIAGFLSRYLPQSIPQLLRFLFIMFIPTVLIFFQPDLGSAFLFVVITAAGLIAGGVGFKRIVITTLALLLTLPLAYTQLKPYQLKRLDSFTNPASDPLGSGYNSLQAVIAVGSGKLFGRGLGQGTQSHLRFLPERHTDFIFASLVEELGFVGGIIIIGSYLWLAHSLLQMARYSVSDLGSIICIATASLIIIQAGINIGMNMGLVPITGITLPFVSSGGSSIISFALLLGVCYSIALRPGKKKPALEIG